MFDHIPVGVGSKGIIPMTARDLEEALEMGMDWSLREGMLSKPQHSKNLILNQIFITLSFIILNWIGTFLSYVV